MFRAIVNARYRVRAYYDLMHPQEWGVPHVPEYETDFQHQTLPQEAKGVYPERVDGRELLDIYYAMTPDEEGADRVDRVIHEASGYWKLQDVKLDEIPWHDESVKAPGSQRLVRKYAKMKGEMPPVILNQTEFGIEIVDGFHRIAAAKLRGDKTIKAYVSGAD